MATSNHPIRCNFKPTLMVLAVLFFLARIAQAGSGVTYDFAGNPAANPFGLTVGLGVTDVAGVVRIGSDEAIEFDFNPMLLSESALLFWW